MSVSCIVCLGTSLSHCCHQRHWSLKKLKMECTHSILCHTEVMDTNRTVFQYRHVLHTYIFFYFVLMCIMFKECQNVSVSFCMYFRCCAMVETSKGKRMFDLKVQSLENFIGRYFHSPRCRHHGDSTNVTAVTRATLITVPSCDGNSNI